MKKVAIAYSEYKPVIDAIKASLDDTEVLTFNAAVQGDFDLIIGVGVGNIDYKGSIPCIVSHYSLLPAFLGEEPVKQAFLAGVKVTGITFYYANTNRIIAQYPLFISNTAHYDEIKKELEYLEQTIYPVIIRKILDNEPFELKDLLSKGCGSCGGCSGCSH